MNNNRGGNNRRRGRGNNNPRPQGANGGQQVNRIDSRARGNAPQMLEKYRKLANDAHLNGDRVNAEYNLQFADHYFRVIADTRVRQEEQRLRRDDRWQEGDADRDEGDDAGEFGAESEFAAFDQPPVYTRREREDRPERTSERANEPTPERVADRGQDRSASQPNYGRRDERPASDSAGTRQQARTYGQEATASAGWTGDATETAASKVDSGESPTAYEPPENPFLRENRGGRGLRPRREDRRPRREDRAETGTAGDMIAGEMASGDMSGQLGETPETDRSIRAISAGIDPNSLPPSFTVPRDEPEGANEAAPAPRRRARRKPAADSGDGSGAGEPIQSLI